MKKQNSFVFKLAMIPLAVSLSMTAGCWLDDDDGGDDDVATTASSGVAFDGYLRGATVCADLNRNKACDDGEPSTTTAAGGAWTLNLTAAQQVFPLVLQANANTIDEDTNAAVDTDLRYSAPAGSTTVSAITTIIQNKVETALATDDTAKTKTTAQLVAEANTALLAQLGLTGTGINLANDDVIAKKKDTALSSTLQDAYGKLHVINQVVTKELVESIPAATSIAGTNTTAAINAAITNVTAIIATVATAVQTAITASGGDLTSADIVNTISTSVASTVAPTAVTTNQIETQAALDTAANTAAASQPTTTTPTGATGGTGG